MYLLGKESVMPKISNTENNIAGAGSIMSTVSGPSTLIINTL